FIEPEGRTVELVAGQAAFIPPTWPCGVTSVRAQAVVVSVASPPPVEGAMYTLPVEIDPPRPAAVVDEDEQPVEPAGDDRQFRVLIDPRHGARHVTQFVGFIHRSRAPFHTHTYEEAIYILEGDGILHVAGDDGFDAPIRPGSSIFLPPGTPHCLENSSDGVLKLLGVFSPPGSPGPRGD
ncbi:MAG: cupin domain-containing protein, partial [Actinomycetota bacterium]